MTPINKRGGKWLVEGTWPDGRTFRYRQTTKGLAKTLWDRILVAKADGSWRELRAELSRKRDPGALATVAELADAYMLQHVEGRGLKGRFHRQTKPVVVRALGSVRLAELGPEHVQRYISLRRVSGVSNATINRGLAFIRGMFSWALPLGHISSHPMAGVKPLKEATKPRRALTMREYRRLVECADAVNPTLGAMVVVAGETALRKSEVLNLRWEDVRGGAVTVRESKSGRHRVVPLSPWARERLAGLGRVVGLPWVWERPDRGADGAPVRWRDPRESFKAAREAAGLPWVGWHDLRHYRLTAWALAGVDLVTVKALAGHSSIQTTMIYTHADADKAAEEVARVAALEAGRLGEKSG